MGDLASHKDETKKRLNALCSKQAVGDVLLALDTKEVVIDLLETERSVGDDSAYDDDIRILLPLFETICNACFDKKILDVYSSVRKKEGIDPRIGKLNKTLDKIVKSCFVLYCRYFEAATDLLPDSEEYCEDFIQTLVNDVSFVSDFGEKIGTKIEDKYYNDEWFEDGLFDEKEISLEATAPVLAALYINLDGLADTFDDLLAFDEAGEIEYTRTQLLKYRGIYQLCALLKESILSYVYVAINLILGAEIREQSAVNSFMEKAEGCICCGELCCKFLECLLGDDDSEEEFDDEFDDEEWDVDCESCPNKGFCSEANDENNEDDDEDDEDDEDDV